MTRRQFARHGRVILGLMLMSMLFAGCGTGAETDATLSGNLVLAGSTALQPLATQAAKLFERQYPRLHVAVNGGGSLAGLTAVTNHQADIGNSDVYADPAVYPDPNLTDHLVCVIPFVMVVNRDEIGTLLKTDSSQTVLETIANTPGAIGYLAVPVVDDHARTVAIDGQLPSRESIEKGRYAFWGFEHMYTLGDTPMIATFLNFMLSDTVQRVAQQLGYIPIADMKLSQLAPSSRSRASA